VAARAIEKKSERKKERKAQEIKFYKPPLSSYYHWWWRETENQVKIMPTQKEELQNLILLLMCMKTNSCSSVSNWSNNMSQNYLSQSCKIAKEKPVTIKSFCIIVASSVVVYAVAAALGWADFLEFKVTSDSNSSTTHNSTRVYCVQQHLSTTPHLGPTCCTVDRERVEMLTVVSYYDLLLLLI